MLEKPDLQAPSIIAAARGQFGLPITRVTFLPIGADANTAVYRAVTDDGSAYFLKLRKGAFDETSVTVPLFLGGQGIQPIIVPLSTRNGHPWGNLDEYRMLLYPFIQGQDAYQVELSDRQWLAFGAAMRAVHALEVPPGIRRHLQPESWSPYWRKLVKTFQVQVENTTFSDPTAVKLAEFMQSKRELIHHLVDRADQLGADLKALQMAMVLCHSDIHPGNLLVTPGDAFYIVDWDAPILAPRERDLMGIGMGGVWNHARQAALFYQGYGKVEMDGMALTYYRFERIVQDIAAYCQQLLLSTDGGDDREQSLGYLVGSFSPGDVVEAALKTDAGWDK
jgi:spectinomycin phosphotransferase